MTPRPATADCEEKASISSYLNTIRLFLIFKNILYLLFLNKYEILRINDPVVDLASTAEARINGNNKLMFLAIIVIKNCQRDSLR